MSLIYFGALALSSLGVIVGTILRNLALQETQQYSTIIKNAWLTLLGTLALTLFIWDYPIASIFPLASLALTFTQLPSWIAFGLLGGVLPLTFSDSRTFLLSSSILFLSGFPFGMRSKDYWGAIALFLVGTALFFLLA